MHPVAFEEKEYEHFLYCQLQTGPPYGWTPGQVLEAKLPFDFVNFVKNRLFWSVQGIAAPPRGVLLSRLFQRRAPGRLPSFRVNCFIQAKRPDFSARMPKRLAQLGPKRPIFKLSLNARQQATISVVARKVGKRGLFVYAAPVFGDSRKLFEYGGAGRVVENSTFPEALGLDGHRAFYYNCPGNRGIVNQGYESVEFPGLASRIDGLRAEASPEGSWGEELGGLRTAVQQGVMEASEAALDPRAAYLAEEWRQISSEMERGLLSELDAAARAGLTSYFYVEAFAFYFNLLWLVVG